MEIVMIKHPIDMNVLYKLPFLLFFLGSFLNGFAQQFVNGDLDGEVRSISDLPDNWTNVPHTDPVCKADNDFEATPDLTNKEGFTTVPGIRGYPYSGTSFLAGLDFGKNQHHEGIQQEVKGFKIGEIYTISFYQCVVKQENAQDTSGSWAVYADKKLLGISEPSSSQHYWNSPDVTWERRTVTFKANRKSYLFKFLPNDDDKNYDSDLDSLTGSLRMGLDMISLNPGEEILEPPIQKDTSQIITKKMNPIKDSPIEIIDSVEIIEEDLLAKQIDTSRLEVVKLIMDHELETDTAKLKDPKEVIFQRPGSLKFDIVPEIDLNVMPNPSSGIFRVLTDQDEFNLTITDMAGRIIYKEEHCTREKQVELNRKGHFLIIVRANDQKAVKKLIIQ
jgi:Secretion system C-terminal sorting domain